jgi:hypothetical protein
MRPLFLVAGIGFAHPAIKVLWKTRAVLPHTSHPIRFASRPLPPAETFVSRRATLVARSANLAARVGACLADRNLPRQ